MKKKQKKDLDVKYILKTYWSFISKYKLLLAGVIIFALILVALSFFANYLFKRIIDEGELFVKGEISSQVLVAAFTIILILWGAQTIATAVARWLRGYFLENLETKTMFDLKRHYYNHISTLSYKFHTTHKTGALIARITRGSSAIERMTDFITFSTLPLLFQIIISGIALVTIDGKIAVIVSLTAIIFVLFSTRIQKIQRKYNILTNKNEDVEKGMISDTFTNIDSIKYYGKEDLVKNKYAALAEKSRKSLFKQWSIGRWNTSGEIIITGFGGLAVLYITLESFVKGFVTLGTVAFAWGLYWTLMETLEHFMDGLRGYNRSVADFSDLFGYGKIKNDIQDKQNAKQMKVTEGEIEFNNISFKYNKLDLFKDFSLAIPKNKKIALVGYSGSGKSTLVKLLYRLYDVDKGQITIDNIDVKDVEQKSLRSELSIVPQECILFDDTLYNNVKFSNPKATHEEVMQAIKFAQLDKAIQNFPQKEKTIVGERGIKLSGGEKQRVSIARAILANKKILVLDEATSSLDSKTEHEIQKDLQELMKGRTSLIIAHRLSTIMNADIIVVLDEGKIVQKGSHRQLISKPGTYKELWNLQKGGYIE